VQAKSLLGLSVSLEKLSLFTVQFQEQTVPIHFFAPGAGTHLRALFEIQHNGKTTSIEKLKNFKSKEANLRIGNIIQTFWQDSSDEEVQRSMAASMAGKMFAKFPKADGVIVIVEAYNLPSMKEFPEKSETYWEPIYAAKFSRNGKTS